MYETLTSIEIAWLAGFLEGEGCFFTSPTGSPGIKVLSTDQDVMAKYSALVQRPVRGPYKDNRGHKDRWEVNLYGQPAIILMGRLVPHMCERRSKRIMGVIGAAQHRELKQGVRQKRAFCHPRLMRYHSDGSCRNCYEIKRRERKVHGLLEHTQSLSAGSPSNP